MNDKFYPSISPLSAGIRGKCPRCGQGALFDGFIKIRPACENCGLDFGFADAGDGPAVFVILLVGFVIVGGALYVELAFQPALWVHVVLWAPVTVLLGLGLLRPLKATLVALQYKHRAEEGRLADK